MQNYSQKKIIRNQHWDYSWDGVYLITICTEDRTHEFGFIEDGEMYLNEKGLAVYLLWYELENHFESCLLDQFVIMPNHIHGLIILDHKNAPQIKSKKIENVIEGMAVGQGHALDLPPSLLFNKIKFEPKTPKSMFLNQLPFQKPDYNTSFKKGRFQSNGKGSISIMVGSFKSAVSKHCNQLGISFKWQSRFYDQIIFDLESYLSAKSYIQNNPKNWDIQTT